MTDTQERKSSPSNLSTSLVDALPTDKLTDALPTDKLVEAAQTLLTTVTGKAVDAAVEHVEGLAGRLSEVAENGGAGLGAALSNGGSSSVTEALKSGASKVTDTVKGAVGMGSGNSDSDGSVGGDGGGGSGGGGGGGGGGAKFMNIVESLDVAAPLRVTYDQWTQFADFPSFMKKVETVDQESDEKLNWKAQVFWSHRSWETTIIEQIPDTHIIWQSTGAKGHADGHVSFHELAPNLTRVVLVLKYYPQGFFEKTANIWRAVGRRARLEFKRFGEHVMTDTLLTPEEDREGWRGEIRDSEVVKTHEEALEDEPDTDTEDADTDDAEYEDADAEYEDTEEDEDGPDEAADEPQDAQDETDDTNDQGGDAQDEQDQEQEDQAPEETQTRRPPRRSRRKESA